MRKYQIDLRVSAVEHINEKYVLIRLTDDKPLPEMIPGQFVEIKVESSQTTFLRRPISIHYVDREKNELWLLVAVVGQGTKAMASLSAGDTMNLVLPLGNGFTISARKTLLVGGGVGVAPLLYAGKAIREAGGEPVFLLGARSAKDLLEIERFRAVGRVLTTTEDGSDGERGFVTDHSVWEKEPFQMISVCGPKPMMVAVARKAREKNIPCEVSLENMMACGLGACLCCVENTTDGNVCVCKEGPIFSTDKLKW